MSVDVFQFRDYREFLRAKIRENEHSRGYQSLLAQAAGCQKSLFSQVLSGKGQLTRDHASELAGFFGLDEAQAEYFICLVDVSRAGSRTLKEHIERRLKSLKKQSRQLAERLREDSLEDPTAEMLYYSSWYWSAIHQIVGIPAYQSPVAIAERLSLPRSQVERAIERLKRMGLIEGASESLRVTKKTIHLPPGSPMNESNHANWRQRAIHDVQSGRKASVHYSSVFTMSKADYEKLAELVRDAVKRSRDLILPSKEEELYCLNLDLFRV